MDKLKNGHRLAVVELDEEVPKGTNNDQNHMRNAQKERWRIVLQALREKVNTHPAEFLVSFVFTIDGESSGLDAFSDFPTDDANHKRIMFGKKHCKKQMCTRESSISIKRYDTNANGLLQTCLVKTPLLFFERYIGFFAAGLFSNLNLNIIKDLFSKLINIILLLGLSTFLSFIAKVFIGIDFTIKVILTVFFTVALLLFALGKWTQHKGFIGFLKRQVNSENSIVFLVNQKRAKIWNAQLLAFFSELRKWKSCLHWTQAPIWKSSVFDLCTFAIY